MLTKSIIASLPKLQMGVTFVYTKLLKANITVPIVMPDIPPEKGEILNNFLVEKYFIEI